MVRMSKRKELKEELFRVQLEQVGYIDDYGRVKAKYRSKYRELAQQAHKIHRAIEMLDELEYQTQDFHN